MINSYPARTKSDNSALFISCSLGYYTLRWTVQTFLSISWLLQSPVPHHIADRTLYHCYKVSYLLSTKHEFCILFYSKMGFYCCYGNWSITRVTGIGGGGCVLIEIDRL